MNKKLKLILSCFCLCLTLGIMSVAVWAATTTNYTLSNTISYKIEDVYVRVQTKLYKKSTAGMVSGEDLISQCEALEGKKHSEITGVTLVETYDEFSTYNGKSAVDPTTTGCNCDIAYDTSAQNPAFAYYVVMEIENYASDPIHAYLINNIPTTSANLFEVEDIYELNSYLYFTSDLVVMEGKSITSVVIGFALKDTTIALSATDAPFDLKINAGEYNPEDFMTFSEVTDDSGAVTGYSVSKKDASIAGPVVIPEAYNGLPVIDIPLNAFYNCMSISSIIIPKSITSIGSSAFRGCILLTSIIIPEDVTSIGIRAFELCKSLTSITIPKGVTSIENSTFVDCTSLKTVSIEKGVTSIGRAVFKNCWQLINVTIPEGVTSIGNFAFNYCKSLTSITIPQGVMDIGVSAFGNCISLAKISLPNSLTSIGSKLFRYCSSLTDITIPEGVLSMGLNLITDCNLLTNLTIKGSTVTNWGYADSADATEWTTIDLTNPETNVTYFRDTYSSMFWKKLA